MDVTADTVRGLGDPSGGIRRRRRARSRSAPARPDLTLAGVGAVAAVLVGVRAALSVRALRTETEERRRLSMTDHLTGLANRRRLFETLEGCLAGFGAHQRELALLFIDLDGFKLVNDSFGHPVGDEILKRVGARLQGSLRPSDLLARVGGDEFAVVLMDAGAKQAAAVATKLSAGLERPFAIDAVSVRVGASIGIALAPADAGDSAGLLRCADVAMYRAKARRRRLVLGAGEGRTATENRHGAQRAMPAHGASELTSRRTTPARGYRGSGDARRATRGSGSAFSSASPSRAAIRSRPCPWRSSF